MNNKVINPTKMFQIGKSTDKQLELVVELEVELVVALVVELEVELELVVETNPVVINSVVVVPAVVPVVPVGGGVCPVVIDPVITPLTPPNKLFKLTPGGVNIWLMVCSTPLVTVKSEVIIAAPFTVANPKETDVPASCVVAPTPLTIAAAKMVIFGIM